MNTRGQGRVFLRTGSPFWWVSYYHNGNEIREAAKDLRTGEKLQAIEELRSKAEKFLADRLHDVKEEEKSGRAFIGPRQERVKVGQLLDSLERDLKLRDKWSIKTTSVVKSVREHFGSWKAVKVSSDAVAEYIENLREDGKSNSTVNHRIQVLGQAFKLGIRAKQVSSAPYIPRLSEKGCEREGFFETADFEAVVAKLPEYLRDFARFGFTTGWRKGSITSLRWADVGDGIIYLRAEHNKTRQRDTMPFVGELAEIIERRRAAAILKSDGAEPRFAEYVFHHDGAPIGDFHKAWRPPAKPRMYRIACSMIFAAPLPAT